jgi:tetratricopeptide (TPR) repeat protein
MDMEQTNKAEYDRLDALGEEACKMWRAGRVDEAIRMGEEYWDSLPEPKHEWELLSQGYPWSFVDRALDSGRPDQARLWLNRLRPAYDDSRIGRELMDLLEGKVRLAEGDEDGALTYFKSVYDSAGKRLFQGEDPKYWEFFAKHAGLKTRKKKVSAKALDKLAEQGNQLCDAGDPYGAIEIWTQALDAIDEPTTDHPAAFWFYASIGDIQVQLEDYEDALTNLNQAQIAGGTDNPLVWLRKGQALIELGHEDQGIEALLSGYMLEGDELFTDEDPKYLNLLTGRGLIHKQ